VLDTSVIAYDSHCLDSLPKNSIIVIHIGVLTELDKLKKFSNDAGRNARYFIRLIDKISAGKEGTRFPLDNGSTLVIDVSSSDASYLGDNTYVDNHLINCARNIQKTSDQYAKDTEVILVSRDINLRMKARGFNITAQDYEKGDKAEGADDIYTGIIYINAPEIGAALYEKGKGGSLDCCDYSDLKDIYPNECIVFEDKDQKVVALARKKNDKIVQVQDHTMWGIKPKNKEQTFAAELLMDPDISLVSLIGFAGTGKTLLSLAAGLEQVIERKKYESLMVYRPLVAVGPELGYIPGTLQEKLNPWMAAIIDGLEFITSNRNKKKNKNNSNPSDDWRKKLGQYADLVQLEALTYIRGRSLPGVIILVDEAQNLSVENCKSILTRASAGTKIILTGDVQQVDAINHLDSTNNGLAKVSEAFKNSPLASHLTLKHGERSALATESARLL